MFKNYHQPSKTTFKMSSQTTSIASEQTSNSTSTSFKTLNPEATPFIPSDFSIAEIDPAIHPCQYCQAPCKGKQCRTCHLKMVSSLQGECIDCKENFFAKRKDGTMRKRCKPCQEKYAEMHYRNCPECSKEYHAFLDDGRVYDKCYDCYNKNLKKCEKCGANSFKGDLCVPCYKTEREKKVSPATRSSSKYDKADSKSCKTTGCKGVTFYTFCKSCNDNKKSLNVYMVYTCKGCGLRGRGDYSYCEECS